MKHILEYDEVDVRDLIQDLGDVGHAKTYKGSLWAHFNAFKKSSGGLMHTTIFCFLETEPFYGTGNEDKDKSIVLEKIQKGEFTVPPFRDPDDPKGGYEPIVKVITRESLIRLSAEFSDLDDFCLQIQKDLKEKQNIYLSPGEIYNSGLMYVSEAKKVFVFGFVGPEDDEMLSIDQIEHRPSLRSYQGITYIK